MEKEMKKLLLVAVSVGIFLLVTITVALIVVTPKINSFETSDSSSIPYSQGRILPSPETSSSVSEQPVINTENANNTAETAAVDSSDGEKVTIQITAPASTAAPVSSTQRTSVTSSTPTPSVSTSSTRQTSSTQTAARTTSTSTSRITTAARPASTKTINDYWIQIGAYRAIIRAEDARELLASKGLVSVIENREINGQNLYRVRLGPYTSEREANHWLAIVKNIDGFSDSQVRQTIRTQ